ncbi:predicted glyoxalase/bleomycin resistance protein/dioxygenase [Alteracholeplasma palmae J233]|uniref:Predicted glyoxalase/bleomycin resistance protein/dioxygenase n=1 Tax=Alteracholeplasma palmae (strain ATCC 49389 / J233) TaxID=1318466 RepID=U4KR37_ALTPJ|nr:VOC family protein [Alteracholeplasma palmae]CCV63836.1 predicted glyoxalase/bleomycin resistance protein/dioxygenase [Alteracholeplasma palmae J233]
MFKRIDTAFVYVSNMEASVNWYKEILGLKVALDYPGYVSFKLGETYLTLIQNKDQINQKFSTFNFFVDDAFATHQYLTEKFVEVTEIKSDGVDHFAFFDLDGNRLEICSFK